MEIKDLQEKTAADLHKMLVEKRNELRELTFKAHEGQLAANHKIKATKKEIAQILTVINQKRLQEVA